MSVSHFSLVLGDLTPLSFQTAKGASENSAMLTVGDTVVNIKCSNCNNVILSGPAEVCLNKLLG